MRCADGDALFRRRIGNAFYPNVQQLFDEPLAEPLILHDLLKQEIIADGEFFPFLNTSHGAALLFFFILQRRDGDWQEESFPNVSGETNCAKTFRFCSIVSRETFDHRKIDWQIPRSQKIPASSSRKIKLCEEL